MVATFSRDDQIVLPWFGCGVAIVAASVPIGAGEMEVGVTPANRRRLGHIARGALSVAVVVGIFVGVLPRIADLDKVWGIIRSVTWREDVLLVLVAAWNIVTYWPVVVAGMPGLTYRQAVLVNQSSTSVAMTLPAGGAIAVGLSYAMYTSWGFKKRDFVRSAVVTGIVNMLVKFVLPVVAVLILAARGEPSDWVVPAALVGLILLTAAVVAFALILWRARFAREIGSALGAAASWVLRRLGKAAVPDWDEVAVRFRRQTIELLRRRGAFLIGATIVSQLSVYVVLLVTLRVVGIPQGDVGWAQALAVFAIVRLASSFPILPGNVGLAELGYIGGLVLVGGDRTAVVAAVLLFRFLTFYAQIPIGAITYILWRRSQRKRSGDGEPGVVFDERATAVKEAGPLGAATTR
jgi:putative heme transporter